MRTIESQIEQYLEFCEKNRRMSDATLAMKRNILRRFVAVTGIIDVAVLNNEAFNKWVNYESGRVGDSTFNMYNSAIVTFVKYCREMGVTVPLNVALVPRVKTRPRARIYYTEEDVGRVVSIAGEVERLQIMILFETGMRIAELVRLKVGDFTGRRVEFIGKGGKYREVYVSLGVLRELDKYREKYRISGYLWVVCDGVKTLNSEPMTVNTVRMKLRETFERAGFEGFYPHALRHSFATDLQRRGATVAEIKEMMGHSSVATTERYLHGFEGRMEELFNKYR